MRFISYQRCVRRETQFRGLAQPAVATGFASRPRRAFLFTGSPHEKKPERRSRYSPIYLWPLCRAGATVLLSLFAVAVCAGAQSTDDPPAGAPQIAGQYKIETE